MDDNELINFDDYSAPSTEVEESLPILNQEDGESPTYEKDSDYSLEDDVFSQDGVKEGEDTEEGEQQDSYEEGDLIAALLRDKGYSNPNEIEIVGEDGNVEKVSFNDLSIEEQRQILSAPDVMLTDEEIQTINFLRQNNTTLRDVVAYGQQVAAQNALKGQNDQHFVVDDASDEQLFIADLKSKYPNLTDEELRDELEDAQFNEDTFQKKVQALREQYKQLEENDRKEAEARAQEEEKQNWQQAYNAILDVAQNTDTLYSLDIDDKDKDDIMRFLLQRDATGKTEFIKLLDNPEALFHLAWFATKGGQAFDTIHQYYQKELETARRGSQKAAPSRPSAVRRQSTHKAADPYGMDKYFS